jgi:hypothetical protein
MLAVISVLIVVTVSILITRIATLALIHTGLSREVARFQARSAFTGAGFTTGESEEVVNHPVRRRIILLLMLLGNAGIVTVVSTLILSFVGPTESVLLTGKILLLVGGLTLLWLLVRSQWIDRHLGHLIEKALKRYTRLEVRDYASLMHLTGEYRIVELRVEPEDWLADKDLAKAELREEGILVLGIRRANGQYLGAPKGSSRILAGDVLILYGRVSGLEMVDQRRRDYRGDLEHEEAMEEHRRVTEQEASQDGSPRPG